MLRRAADCPTGGLVPRELCQIRASIHCLARLVFRSPMNLGNGIPLAPAQEAAACRMTPLSVSSPQFLTANRNFIFGHQPGTAAEFDRELDADGRLGSADQLRNTVNLFQSLLRAA